MIAVIKTGGKQYKVKENDVLRVEKLEVEAGKPVVFDEVLLVASEDGATVNVGTPFVTGAKVTAEVLVEAGKAEKIRVIKFKNKIRYKRVRGHRQLFTEVRITKIA